MWKFLLGVLIGIIVTVFGIFVVFLALGRLFANKAPSVPGDSALVLSLRGDVPESAPVDMAIPFFEQKTAPTVRDLWTSLHEAAADNRIKAVILEPQHLVAGWGRLQELRQELLDFKRSGKPVYAYLQSPGSREYYLASAADRIYLSPSDMLEVKGFLLETMYFKEGLDKLGIQFQVDRRRIARQHDDSSARRKGINFLAVQVHLDRRQEVARILHVALPLHQLAKPGDALILESRTFAAFFVFPVRGDALFRDAVHLFCSNLNLEGHAARSNNRCMQRLVKIGPRHRDEILDAARHRMPFVVNHTECRVAVFHRVGNDANGDNVVDLIERDLLAFEFQVDRIGALHAAFDARRDVLARQPLLDLALHLFQPVLIFLTLGFDFANKVGGRFRMQSLEREVFQLAANLAHSKTMRDRRIDIDRLLRNRLLALARQGCDRAQVMQTVGKFDDDHADIGGHREQHLA